MIIEGGNIAVYLAYAVAGIPMVIFFFLIFFGRTINRFRGVIATTAMFVSTLMAVFVLMNTLSLGTFYFSFPWIEFGERSIEAAIRIDFISAFLALIVCFVSLLVHLFSIEYLRGEKDFEKYFAYLALFTSSMIFMIWSANLMGMFIFWELMGFSSYLLIGFWYTKESAIFANKKAFLVNRVGDLGFLIGLFGVWSIYGTLDLAQILASDISSTPLLILTGFGFMTAALSKSAQFPLHVWLPNAMEGPTPVSALIHAATMVAAGIYLLFRVFPLLDPVVLNTMITLGGTTLLLGAFAATAQTDIKQVLAYSTISQLGYMLLAMGLGAHHAAMFHLVTHAFFKACLFLGAGAIIHSMHTVKKQLNKQEGKKVSFDVQNMAFMGGLRKAHPVTFFSNTLATAAIIGLPFFSGFLSKDAILGASLAWAEKGGNIIIPIVAFSGVLLTAFYMSRQYFMVFYGDFKLKRKGEAYAYAENYLENTPWPMRIPNVILALLSLGFVFSLNPFHYEHSWLFEVLSTPELAASYIPKAAWVVPVLSTLLALLGITVAYVAFCTEKLNGVTAQYFSYQKPFVLFLKNGFRLNELYHFLFVRSNLLLAAISNILDKFLVDGIVSLVYKIQLQVSKLLVFIDNKVLDRSVVQFVRFNVIFAHLLAWKDRVIIDGIALGTAQTASFVGSVGRLMQNGKIQSYVWTAVFGVFLLIIGLILI